MEESHTATRAILEESMTSVLAQLEARHHKSELDIMERMEQVEMARRQIQAAVTKPGPERLRLEEVLMRLEQRVVPQNVAGREGGVAAKVDFAQRREPAQVERVVLSPLQKGRVCRDG